MATSNQATGTLTSGTPVVINMASIKYPCTIVLKSAAGGRLIRLSVDGGNEFFIPTVDATASSASQQVVTLSSPVSDVEFTGANGDVWITL